MDEAIDDEKIKDLGRRCKSVGQSQLARVCEIALLPDHPEHARGREMALKYCAELEEMERPLSASEARASIKSGRPWALAQR